MTAPLVIGLDLSLNSAGVAGSDWADVLRPHRDSKGHPRLEWLRQEIADRCKHADLVVVEGPSYGSSNQTGYHEMAGLWWTITHDLWRKHLPYAVVAPDSRTIYATGKARHKHEDGSRWLKSLEVKGLVRAAVIDRYGVDCDGPGRYDKADAVILAHMGLAWLGYPAADLPPTHTRALKAVAWPEQTVVAAA